MKPTAKNTFFMQYLPQLVFILCVIIGWYILRDFLNNLSRSLPPKLYVEYWASMITLSFDSPNLFGYRLNWLVILLIALWSVLLEFLLIMLMGRIYANKQRPEQQLKNDINAAPAISLFKGFLLDEWPLGGTKYLYYQAKRVYFVITGIFGLVIFSIFFIIEAPILDEPHSFSRFALLASYLYSYCSIKLILLSSLRLVIAGRFKRFTPPVINKGKKSESFT